MSAPGPEYLILTFASIILILFLSGLIIAALHRHQQSLLAFRKNIAQLKHLHEKQLLETRIELQEQTFREISTEIHDNISPGLILSKLHLHTLTATGAPPEQQKNLGLSMELITRAIRDLRNIARSFDAETIIREGLLPAIESRLNNLNNTGLFHIEYQVAGTVRLLEPRVALSCFRIIQEALNNIVKHSRASNLLLSLAFHDTSVELRIEDDGIGMETWKMYAGSGLRNIRQRASLLKAGCEITSAPGRGTSIRINIPLTTDHPLNYRNEQRKNADQNCAR